LFDLFAAFARNKSTEVHPAEKLVALGINRDEVFHSSALDHFRFPQRDQHLYFVVFFFDVVSQHPEWKEKIKGL